jgi:hypothetical protein
MNIIDGLQKKTIIRLEKLITTIGWLVMLGYITQILFSIVICLFYLSNFDGYMQKYRFEVCISILYYKKLFCKTFHLHFFFVKK